MAEREKPLWVQVMEAGFGETLEAHGFRKRSPGVYRLDGDGLYWEQFTYRGYNKDANSFQEAHGTFVFNSEELFHKFIGFPKKFDIIPIRYTLEGRRYDMGGSIADSHEIDQYQAYHSRSSVAFFGKLLDMFRGEKPYWLYDIAKHYCMDISTGNRYWSSLDCPVEEVAGEMSKYWTKHVWENDISKCRTIYDLACCKFNGSLEHTHRNVENALYNHLAGRHEATRSYLEATLQKGRNTLVEIMGELEENSPAGLRQYDEEDPGSEYYLVKIARIRQRDYRRWADAARRLADGIGLRV